MREEGKEEREEDRERKEDKKREEDKDRDASLYTKMIDSISANYRSHNCQCFINETNYLS